MSDARQNILGTIARNKVKSNDRSESPHTVVGCTHFSEEDILRLFIERVEASSATLERIGSLKDFPKEVRNYVLKRLLGSGKPTFNINNPQLDDLSWDSVAELIPKEISPECSISVTSAYCGIAETGSVVLLSETDRSTAAYFLPDTLIVALAEDDIVATQESVWTRLHADHQSMPRSVIFMTGPSRTGDIEQKIVIGAHGPRRVHLVLYRNR